MAFTSDGSRICDSNRNPLVAIDANYTLVDKATEKIIYAVGIIGVTGDRMRAATGNVTLHFRALGGTFAAVTNVTAVKIAQTTTDTVLVNATSVTAVNAKNNKTPTFIEGGQEVEAVASSTAATSIDIRDIQSGEWQFALDFSGAAAGTTYEFKAVVVQDVANADIVYAAKVTTSIGQVSSSVTASFGATSLSLTLTAGAVNNLLIASGGYTGVREAAATISDTQGNTWFQCNPDVNDAINTWRLASWYALAKNTTSTTVTILSNSSSSVMTITLVEFRGTASVAPLDQTAANATGNSSDNTLASPVFTPRYDSELVWATQFDNSTIAGAIDGVAASLLTDDANGTVSEYGVLLRKAGKAMQATFGDGGLTDILVASFMRPLSIEAPRIVQKLQVRPFPYAPGSPRSN